MAVWMLVGTLAWLEKLEDFASLRLPVVAARASFVPRYQRRCRRAIVVRCGLGDRAIGVCCRHGVAVIANSCDCAIVLLSGRATVLVCSSGCQRRSCDCTVIIHNARGGRAVSVCNRGGRAVGTGGGRRAVSRSS